MATTTSQVRIGVATQEYKRPPRSLWADAWFTFTRDKLAMAGLAMLALLVLATLIGPFFYERPVGVIDFEKALLGPSLEHPFGTDDLGRDLLGRSLWGGRVSIAVGIIAVLIAISLGTAIGAVAGYFRKADNPLMRVTDIFLSLPILPLLLVIIFLFREEVARRFGPDVGIFIMIVAVIGVLNWMPVARLVRASFLSLKNKEFVEAARAGGSSSRTSSRMCSARSSSRRRSGSAARS